MPKMIALCLAVSASASLVAGVEAAVAGVGKVVDAASANKRGDSPRCNLDGSGVRVCSPDGCTVRATGMRHKSCSEFCQENLRLGCANGWAVATPRSGDCRGRSAIGCRARRDVKDLLC